jgi:hypothetical protein
MRLLSPTQVQAQKVAELGLDPGALDLESTEAIAGALRRLAGFACPCSARTLVSGVVQPLRGLVPQSDEFHFKVEETLEAIVAYGDLLEFRNVEENVTRVSATLLYTAPAGFVMRQSGQVMLIGIAADQLSALPTELASRVEYVNHVRRLSPIVGENLAEELRQIGLMEFSYAEWLKAPRLETPTQHIASFDQLLESAPPSRDIPGLVLLDPQRPVRYYRGRWTEPRSQSGRFVGRRSQAYGANLWCYVELRDGNPIRFIDLPKSGSRWRGCDEAWRLQMAIDATRLIPQTMRLSEGIGESQIMKFYSPVPMWAQRKWDSVGEPIPPDGCLISYRFKASEIAEEEQFCRDYLWLCSERQSSS